MKKYFNIILVACLIVSTCYVPKVQAKTVGDLKSELNQYESDYNNNKLQQEMSEKEINTIKSNINSINSTISDMSDDIDDDNFYDTVGGKSDE